MMLYSNKGHLHHDLFGRYSALQESGSDTELVMF